MNISRQLNLVDELQHALPNCMLGGSLALHLYGFDLGRDLFDSDLDFTIDDMFASAQIKHLVRPAEDQDTSADMEFKYVADNGIKVEFQVDEYAPKPIVIVAVARFIRLAPIGFIIQHKLRYANLGIEKHINDLTAMGLADLVKGIKIDF